jgi:hypothetical protein
MRLFALTFAALSLSTTAPAPARSPLPENVALSLLNGGIDVRDASDLTAAAFPVTARRAARIAWRNFHDRAPADTSGWVRVGRVTVHLVRVRRSNTVGPLGLFPDQLVWLVVIRDVTIPNLGPSGNPAPRSFNAMLGVFVRTDTPQFIAAATF